MRLRFPASPRPRRGLDSSYYAIDATRVRGLEGQADAAVALLVASGLALVLAAVAAVLARRLDGVRR